jgi:signal peptidase I
MTDLPYPIPNLHKRDGGILSLSGPALLDLLRAVLEKNASFRFTALGFSMSPFIKNGDVITVSQCVVNAIRMGDVAAFVDSSSNRLMVHRIIALSKDACLIKGDNLPETDGWIPRARVMGRVTRVGRSGRRVRFGMGVERVVIAFLSRFTRLIPFFISFDRPRFSSFKGRIL